ncbi:DUF6286 domain-containing protein [Streptomyces mangrovisoli]|uniref:DUF6286 domain-containing protein n=1 Tax=Streptomyces mangrovisoli TaxID=1428628 RepID=A0A1J4NXD2_9ACTN|nr:DUF6286 domain-containing protein [Streptomyces mangrovisoli]OIJ66148.1 hypothetical protein WN71_019890 [Streptomyces mangrovisoli]
MSEPQGSQGTTQRLPVLEKRDPSDPGWSPDEPSPPVLDGEGGGKGRFWSARRVPAGIVALVLLVVSGVSLYDVVAVRTGHSAMAWRHGLANQLAERPLDDTWVLVGSGVAAALGLWLVVLAATPGLRKVLPMRSPRTDVRAGLHRTAVALVLRDRAMEVAGVQSVRVRVRRHKADVRASSHYRELDDVHADLDTALTEASEGLGLVRAPAVSVRVGRAGRKG